MNLSQETLLELMAYTDGELDGDDKRRIEALLASSVDARRAVESMARLGDEIERAYAQPEPAAYESIADRVMEEVTRAEAEVPKKQLRPGKVIDLREARERRIKIGAAVIAAVSLAAAAAGIALTTRHTNQNAPPGLAGNHVPAPAPAPRGSGAQVAGAAGVDVEEVDSARDVQVYYLPSIGGNGSASSVMVWIDDKGPVSP